MEEEENVTSVEKGRKEARRESNVPRGEETIENLRAMNM